MGWFLDGLKKYVVFSGRARRKAYWMYTLFAMIFAIPLLILDAVFDTDGIFLGLYSLAIFLPNISLQVRRLHDIGKSAWFLLIYFIPLIGFIWFLVLMCTDSATGDNQYGPNPKAVVSMP